MKKVRFGIVGMGIMGAGHAEIIQTAASRDFCLTATAEIDPAAIRAAKRKFGVPCFPDGQQMYNSGLCDAVIIATPHYWHPPLTIRAARAGLHVLCEKPLAVTVGPVRAMIAECRKRKVAFGAMLQQRTRGIMMKMKQMVDSGQLGDVFRVSMVCSDWTRTQKYYRLGAWRGTWDGEGGGILLNQAPHSLDLFQWIGMGLPKRVHALLATREHRIEVEDTANVLCDYGDGKVGYLYASTAEEPGMEQLTVVGDKGTLVAEGRSLRWGKLKTPIRKHVYGSKSRMGGGGEQETTWTDVPLPKDPGGGHILVIKAFAGSVLRGEPMVATGAEAINELEISNAAYVSGFKDKTVDLPIGAVEMDRLLTKLKRERSTGRGGDLKEQGAADMRKLRKK